MLLWRVNSRNFQLCIYEVVSAFNIQEWCYILNLCKRLLTSRALKSLRSILNDLPTISGSTISRKSRPCEESPALHQTSTEAAS